MQTLKYDYMDKVVELKAIKSGCCDGYFLVEQLNAVGHEPQIVAGPYLTEKATLIAGQKYIEGKIIMKKREATEDEGACLARAGFEAGYIA